MLRKSLLSQQPLVRVFRPALKSQVPKINLAPSISAAKSVAFAQLSIRKPLTGTFFPAVLARHFATQPASPTSAQQEPVETRLLLEFDAETNRYKLTVPLPGAENNKCLFVIAPDQTIRSFLIDLQHEDATIRTASISANGARVAQSTRLQDVVKDGFQLKLNNAKFNVPAIAAVQSEFAKDETARILQEFKPLYAKKRELDQRALRYSDFMMWGGLGFLCAQWAFLARLTWWDFNWDIMEPVTYFITFGTAVIGYAYFVVAKRDYTFTDLRESIAAKRMFKNYVSNEFPMDKYFALEHELRRRDPHLIEQVEYTLETEEFRQQKN